MNKCIKCCSTEIEIKSKNFGEDLHNILKIFTCKRCGHKETKLVNIQEGPHDE